MRFAFIAYNEVFCLRNTSLEEVVGFEPTNADVKNQCLKPTWRYLYGVAM